MSTKILQIVKKTPTAVTNLGRFVKFPDKLKGTFLEKWADYWKNLFIDYRQMAQELRSDIQDEPIKAMKWITALGTVYILGLNNPDEIDFRSNLKTVNNDIILVGNDCINSESIEHVKFLQTCYNQNVIHYSNLGIASIMYVSELGNSCDLYKAHCTHLQPSIISFPLRIVDVGIMGRWWNLYIKTCNYDVNV